MLPPKLGMAAMRLLSAGHTELPLIPPLATLFYAQEAAS